MFKLLNTIKETQNIVSECDICILCDQPVDNCEYCDAFMDDCAHHYDI